MSAGWNIGDLALCVDDRQHPAHSHNLKAGSSYRVIGLGELGRSTLYPGRICHGLFLSGAQTSSKLGFAPERFRKIEPDKHEGDIADWQLILETNKRKVSA